MLRNKLGGIDVGVVLLSSSWSNSPRGSINRVLNHFHARLWRRFDPNRLTGVLTFHLIHLNILGTSPLHKKCRGRLRMDHQLNCRIIRCTHTHACMHTHERKKRMLVYKFRWQHYFFVYLFFHFCISPSTLHFPSPAGDSPWNINYDALSRRCASPTERRYVRVHRCPSWGLCSAC